MNYVIKAMNYVIKASAVWDEERQLAFRRSLSSFYVDYKLKFKALKDTGVMFFSLLIVNLIMTRNKNHGIVWTYTIVNDITHTRYNSVINRLSPMV